MRNELNFQTTPLAELERKGLVPDAQPRPVVLIVHDEQIIADTRQAILTDWGYTVISAYTAETALAKARLSPPDLLVSDVTLHKTNGIDLAIAIRRTSPDCRVILSASRIEGADLIASAERAGHEFTLLSKPIQLIRLRSLLAEMSPGGNPGTAYA